MTDSDERRTCTAAERDLLDMIACWPGVPASVIIHEDGRYSVSTAEGWGKGDAVNARATAAFAPDQDVAPVTHDRAENAARRLISSHFGLADRARITVPPRWAADDDCVLMSYIRQQRAAGELQDQQVSVQEPVSLPPDERSEAELRAAKEEEDHRDRAFADARLNEAGLPYLGEGGAPLDAIFRTLRNADLLHRSGGVMHSPESALRPAPLLFMGLNPGGDERAISSTILDSLVSCRMGLSAWEEDWDGNPGEALLQRRFKQVAGLIGLDPLTIPATNVVFTRSRNVASHGRWSEDRRAMAAVHDIFAETIQPEKLWFMGDPNAAGDLLTDLKIDWRTARHKDWSIGHGTAVYRGRKVVLCHTPHLSVWDPTGKEDELRFAFGLPG